MSGWAEAPSWVGVRVWAQYQERPWDQCPFCFPTVTAGEYVLSFLPGDPPTNGTHLYPLCPRHAWQKAEEWLAHLEVPA